MIVVRKSQIQELEKKRKKSNLQMLFMGLMIGAAIGSIIAILLTPYEGQTVRSRIGSTCGSLMDKCNSMFGCCSDEEYCCCGCGEAIEAEEESTEV